MSPLLLVRPLPKKSLIKVTDVPPFIGQAITQERFDISHWCPPPFIGQTITQEKFDTSHWCPLLLVRPLSKKSLIQVTDVPPFYWSGHYPRKVWYKSLMSSFIGQAITQEKFDTSHWCPLLLVRTLSKKSLIQVTDVPLFYWSGHYPRKVWYKSLMSPLLLVRPLPKKSLIQVTDVPNVLTNKRGGHQWLVSSFSWIMSWPIKEDISDLYQTFLG
jgi:hypothetical protein